MTIYLLHLFLLFGSAESFTLRQPHVNIAPPNVSTNAGQAQPPALLFQRTSSTELKMAKVVTPEKIAGRKKRVKGFYKLLAAESGLFSAAIYAKSHNPFYSVGPFLGGAVSYILLGAAANDRLSSDTYKRLNLGLFTYGFIALFAGNFMNFPKIWAASCVIAMINTVKGYGYGLKGWELKPACAKEDFINGFKATTKSLLKLPNLNSAGYLAGVLTLATLVITKIQDIINSIQSNAGTYMLGQCLFQLSMFFILTVIMFTLKDASDRDRLEGTTFIELNAMLGLSFATLTWEAYRKATFSPLHAGVSAFFSLLTAFNAVSSMLKKKKA